MSGTLFATPIVTGSSGSVQVTSTGLNVVSASSGLVQAIGTVTPADAEANPTNAIVTEDHNMVWNAVTWDRVRAGAATGSVAVGSQVTDVDSLANTQSMQLAVPGGSGNLIVYPHVLNTSTSWDRLRSGNALGSVAVQPVTSSGGSVLASTAGLSVVTASSGAVQISGTPTVVVASSAGLTQTVSVVNASSGLVQISGVPAVTISTAAIGATPFYSVFTTVQAISTAAANLFGVWAWSTSAPAGVYFNLQLFNATTGNVTPGTTAPTLVIPFGSLTSAGGSDATAAISGVQFGYPGIRFGTAISGVVTTLSSNAALLTDNTYVNAAFI